MPLPALTGPAFFADPYPTYAALRATDAAVWDKATNSWLVPSYDAVHRLLRDPALSKRLPTPDPGPFDRAMLFQDGAAHARTRRRYGPLLSGTALERMEAGIAAEVDRLIDAMARHRGGDFIAEFALPLPLRTIMRLLGIPGADEGFLRARCDAFVPDEDAPVPAPSRQAPAQAELTGYFAELCARRRRQPGDDLLSALLHARPDTDRGGDKDGTKDDGGDDEVVGNCILLLVAGHETTVNLLGNGVWLLRTHPGAAAALRADPALWPGAVEEMLRFESPVQLTTFRAATTPVQYCGTPIPAGALVTGVIGAANRDPAQFPDPDRFDIHRSPNRHLGFGGGPHACFGAALSRLEARMGFRRLMERLPGVFAPPRPRVWERLGAAIAPRPPGVSKAAPAWRRTPVTRGLRHLPVAW